MVITIADMYTLTNINWIILAKIVKLQIARIRNIMAAKLMTYCPKCGTVNEEDARFCKKCGAALFPSEVVQPGQQIPPSRRRMEDECFGLPNGGAIAGLIFGVIIILFGVSMFFKWSFWDNFWVFIVIFIGILLVAGALYRSTRRAKYWPEHLFFFLIFVLAI